MNTSPPSGLSQAFGRLSRLPRTAAAQRVFRLPRWRGAASVLGAILLLVLAPRLYAAETVLFLEDFEGNFPTAGGWNVQFANPFGGTPAYWTKVNAAFGGEGAHSGSWKGYCAGSLYPVNSSEPNPTCPGEQWVVLLSRSLDLSGYSSATLSFWYKMPSMNGTYLATVGLDGGATGINLWFPSTGATAWTEVTVDLTPHAGSSYTLYFLFVLLVGSSNSEGWYLDDIVVSGVQSLPLTLTQQPQSQSVGLGNPAAFRVTGSGAPPLSYQWFKDNQPMADRTDDALNIPSAQFGDIGVYRAGVTDSSGQSLLSEPAVLVVQNGCVNYEDILPPDPFWYYGDQFVSGAVAHRVGEFIFRNGLRSTAGTVAVQPGEFGQEIFTEGATVFFELPQLVSALSLHFRESSDDMFLRINGQWLTAESLIDLDNQSLGNVWISAAPDPLTGGGRLYLVGPMAQIGIGGEKLALDEVCFGLAPPEPPACLDFEDQPAPPQKYFVGDSFPASMVKGTVEPFEWVPGTPITTGHVEVENGAHAGGSAQELFASQVNLGFELGQDWSIVTLRYDEAFGPFNLRVGPELRWVPQTLADLNNEVVDGVLVTVVPGAQPHQGVLTLRGPVRSFAIGGVELYLDRVCPFEELEIICPPDIVAPPDPGQCEKANVTFTVTAVGNCPGISVACNPPSGSTFPVGTTTVNCTATDACGKSNQCSFNVIIVEPQPPVITFRPPDVTVECGQPTDPAHTGGPATATDNCDPNPTITYSDCALVEVTSAVYGWDFTEELRLGGSPEVPPRAELEMVEGPAQPLLGSGSLRAGVYPGSDQWSVAIAHCRSSRYHNVLLREVTELRMATFATIDNPVLTLHVDTDSDGVADDDLHFDPSLQQGGSSWPDQGPVLANTWQTWNALIGGWGSIHGYSTLGDYLPSFPDARIVNTSLGGVGWELGCGLPQHEEAYLDFMILGTNGVSTVYNFENTPGEQCPVKQYIARTWTATDASGNKSASWTQIITVVDTEPPVLTCVPDKIVSGDTPWEFDPPSVTEACGSVTLEVVSTETNIIREGLIATRTWKATDDCNHTSYCSQTVTNLTRPPTPCPPFLAAPVYPTGAYPSAVAVDDFNGDHLADLAVANYGGGVSVLIGRGDGTYRGATTYPAGLNPASVATADFNGDGKKDLVVANAGSGNVSVLLNQGDGSYQAAINSPAGSSPGAVAVGDFDQDGLVDLAVASKVSAGTVTVLRGLGDGTFGPPDPLPVGNTPVAVAVGHFNNDLFPDLAVANLGSANVSVLLNDGLGFFGTAVQHAAGPRPASVAVGHFDGNGWSDLVVANNDSAGMVRVLLGDGSGGFASPVPYAAGPFPWSLVVTDFTGDNQADLAVANWTTPGVYPVTILPGVGDGTFLAPISYAGGPCPYALAAGELNGDNSPDLAVANYVPSGSGVSVLLGGANGRFQAAVNFAAGPGPVSVAGGDFNGDGQAELVVVNTDNAHPSVSVLTNDGTAFFPGRVRYAVAADPRAVAVADVDADGHADLVVACYSTTVSVLRGNGDGSFEPAVNSAAGPAGASATGVAVADLDGDNDADLAVVNFLAHTVSVLPGTGGVSFPNRTAYSAGNSPLALAVGYFNADPHPDLAVVNCLNLGTVSVLLNAGDGSFPNQVPYNVGTFPRSVAVGDFNGDRRADLAVGNSSSATVSVLLGNGDGTFQSATHIAAGSNPYSVAVGDFDGDGHADLAVANAPYEGSVTVLFNSGQYDGTFQPAVAYAAGSQSRAVAAADFNGDGRPDLTVGNYASATVSVLLANDCGVVAIPRLRIEYSGNRAVLSWPTSALDFHLVTTTDLNTPNSWEPVRLPVWTLGDENKVTTSILPGPHFYRLRKP